VASYHLGLLPSNVVPSPAASIFLAGSEVYGRGVGAISNGKSYPTIASTTESYISIIV
jgi:hypothetical protein